MTPVVAPTVMLAIFEDDHVPPAAVLVSVVVAPKQVVVSPAIADNGLTVIFLVAIQPVAVSW
jgi:hypothetical protein